MVIAPACQAGDRGFDPRHSRIKVCRAVAQWLARLVRDQEIGGSNPLSPKIKLYIVSNYVKVIQSEK